MSGCLWMLPIVFHGYHLWHIIFISDFVFRNQTGCHTIIMPRKPTRRGQLKKPQPAFSRLARSMALVTSARKVKQQSVNSPVHRKVPPKFNGSSKEKHDTTQAKREESHSSSEDEDFSSEDDIEGVVQADFAFFDPKPDDFHGVKVLMQTYLDNKEWDLSGLVDLILQQTTVGTVIKIEDDEDNGVYGFVTALNLQRYKDFKCMMELKEFLLTMCQDTEIKDNLRSYLGEQAVDVGLLISQRVVNLPPQLLPPMYDGLFDEISWATEDEPTKELRKSFCFKYYLLVSKIYKHKNGDQKKKGSSSSEEAIIYLKPEDEIFHNLSAWSFCFPLRTQQVTTNELKDYRSMGLVMAVNATSIPTFRQQLHSLIDET
ncbi:protein BCCIP homolog isoform X1 [Cynara cardunculus var. scolymus]|uniref:protein BCCIP homolog isoform X1 n=2 Tax=Cynara cardunculus var. scolymus TaxID=59895 RepID=UPI000D62A528|nr:protein BCCIP homolog isoform X1 [Cynara cardunculus var. scolymus]